MQRVRICDIAQDLGLSTATVSNVIHGKTARVSDETVRRVQEELERREYIPSMAAVLLAQNDSKIIGVFVNDHEKYEGHTLDDVFIAASLNHLSTQIEAHGLYMMVKKAKQAEEILRFASMWNMDGVVVIGFCMQDYAYLRRRMRIPFVVYDGICENPERIANITIDNFDGGHQVGELFARLGHTRALCVSDNDIGIDHERMEGFDAGFGRAAERLIVPMQGAERQHFYRQNIGLLCAATAVFAVSDHYAVDVMHFLADNGRAVPQDVSIAGFDDSPLCAAVRPALTTVRQDGAARAQVAIEKLLALRAGEQTQTSVTLAVQLVERESTAAAPEK